MDTVVYIPDELAELWGTDDLGHRAVEALTLEAFRAGRLTKPDVQRLLGFSSDADTEAFLTVVRGADARQEARSDADGSDAIVARFRAFRIGKTLGGLNPADLIREGRR